MTLGEKIREIRKKKKMTMAELGKKIGVSVQAISQYELNKRDIGIELTKNIADALGVDLDDLVEDESSIKKIQKEINKLKSTIFDLKIKREAQSNLYDSLLSESIDDPENEVIKKKLMIAEEECNKIDDFILSFERSLKTTEERLSRYQITVGTYKEFGDYYTDEKKMEGVKKLLDEIISATNDENRRNELLISFHKLNDTGKKEAIKRVNELTQIDVYTREETIIINSDEAE